MSGPESTTTEAACQVIIYDGQRLAFSESCPTPLYLGRQMATEETLFQLSPAPQQGGHRLAIAPCEESALSRWQVRIEAQLDRVKVLNLSKSIELELGHGQRLPAGGSCVLALPTSLRLGSRQIKISESELVSEDGLLQSLSEPPSRPIGAPVIENLTLPPGQASMDQESIIRWLQTAMGVLQSAASDSSFFQKAAEAVVSMIGMDAGRVLVLRDGVWETVARHASGPGSDRGGQISQTVLARVVREQRTFWLNPSATGGSSLIGLSSVVASPVLDPTGQVIAALCGERVSRPRLASPDASGVSKVDAMLLDLLAGSVAAGLARVDREKEAVRLQAQFENFFTPELARDLAGHPELLVGRDMQITVLFGDIRGFSRMARRLGPARTLEWINDVMGTLSDCVLGRRGVLVDYIGDEIMAMWGAPRPEPDHAWQACLAANDMIAALPALNERWEAVLGEPMDLGIGINTGVARVGNTGSSRKFKYGPLGDTVNVASRVQGANKYYRTRVLLTAASREALPEGVACRRLGAVRAINLSDPIELHELAPADRPDWDALRNTYEGALTEFESRRFREAARSLGNLIIEYPNDGPSLMLMSRVASSLLEDHPAFDPAFLLPGK